MFSRKTSTFGAKQLPNSERRILDLEHKHELELARLDQEHQLAIREKEFELRHFKDDEVLKLKEELANANQEIAVLKKENTMLDKLVSINSDVIDVKTLVEKLIDKLPSINLESLTVNNSKK